MALTATHDATFLCGVEVSWYEKRLFWLVASLPVTLSHTHSLTNSSFHQNPSDLGENIYTKHNIYSRNISIFQIILINRLQLNNQEKFKEKKIQRNFDKHINIHFVSLVYLSWDKSINEHYYAHSFMNHVNTQCIP